MKIAFTSCMSTTVFAQQPVWDQIAAQHPDRLLLLGDSIYIDAMPYPNQATHPKQLELTDFQQHVLARWRLQLDQPQFRALVQKVPTDAIWDDHDFLWDEASTEGAIGRKIYDENIRISRALFNAFCRTLEARLAPGSFPTAYNDWEINQRNEPPPGYKFRPLADDLKLHLTDGRSWRIRKDLLGADQRARIEANLAASPKAVHLLASGSVVNDDCGEHWNLFDDHDWLMAQARKYKILVLSGDIHANRFKSIDLGGGQWLNELMTPCQKLAKSYGSGCHAPEY